MEGIPLKRIKLDGQENIYDAAKCIICQIETATNTTSTENGRNNIKLAADIRKDDVADRLEKADKNSFVYHMSNDCYKKYTLKKTLDKIKERQLTGNALNDIDDKHSPHTQRRSKSVPRHPPKSSRPNDFYNVPCVICAAAKRDSIYEKCRISETDRANKFLQATVYFHDDVYTRTCDLQDEYAIFGADIYCHKNCIRNYLQKYDRRLTTSKGQNEPLKIAVFTNLSLFLHCTKCTDNVIKMMIIFFALFQFTSTSSYISFVSVTLN